MILHSNAEMHGSLHPRRLFHVCSFRFFTLICLFIFGATFTFPGPRIRSLSFQGNHVLSFREVRDVVQSHEGGLFDRHALAADLNRITDRYEQEGYLSATAGIGSLLWNNDSTFADVTIVINEGEKAVLGSIEVEGNTLMTTDEILREIETHPGMALDQPLLEQDIDLLVRRYERSGYPFASIAIDRIEPAADRKSLRLVLAITEGSRIRIDEVHVNGNTETKEHVIVREAGIPLGEPYNTDIIDRATKRLQRMNLFASIAPPELYVTDKGNGGIVFSVTEGNTNTFDGVLGYVPAPEGTGESGYATGMVNVSMVNLFGTARKLAFRWQKDDRYSQQLSVRYNEPWVFEFPIDLSGSFDQRQQDTTYIRRASEFRADLRVIDLLTVGGIASFDYVIPSSSAASFLASSRTISTGIEVDYDSRDDNLSPTSGVLYHTDYRVGTKSIDATSHLQGSGTSVQSVSLDAEGYAQPILHQVVAVGLHGRQLTSGSIELGDLYRFGGATTLRGYRENQFLGSRIAWTNLEYRMLLARRSYFFGFLDNGYYFLPADSNLGTTESNAYRMGYGVGIRLETSLGNIGVSFAFGQGDSFSQGKIHINIINTF